MATWITHLRVAENILDRGFDLEPVPFIIGNIGPDSGVPNNDWSSFTPPKKITHWLGSDKIINAHNFVDKYIADKVKEDNDRYSFIIGYYVHLLTDIEWSKVYNEKKKETLYKEGLDKDPNFIWVIKKDWYGLDYLYLEKHQKSIFHMIFKNINKVPDYLDYFPKGAFERQVKYITEFYLGKNNQTKENFIYITEEEMNNFVNNRTEKIENELKKLLK